MAAPVSSTLDIWPPSPHWHVVVSTMSRMPSCFSPSSKAWRFDRCPFVIADLEKLNAKLVEWCVEDFGVILDCIPQAAIISPVRNDNQILGLGLTARMLLADFNRTK
ncbi:hypothetical protein ED733_006797 [Metarhizium rileyi]|uniref:Uncharacterized protein n=1 Tax=Metarhizium rileyi (strain RCEF 4871) TaxID=1649241 RepID=A0A5C6GP43_METRR|nr:hypothetical protein ED733_006797 [Metarhizium rileyi]